MVKNHDNNLLEKGTIGELRRKLKKLGNPWTVSTNFTDDDPLPRYSRGGEFVDPKNFKLIEDVKSHVSSTVPTNPFLRKRWVDMGILEGDDSVILNGSQPEDNDNSDSSKVSSVDRG